jgi:hypothetical protein
MHMISGPSGFGDGALVPFTDSIWTATTPIRFAGTWFPHVMAVVRLTSGDLLLHSPCRPMVDLIADIARVGRVAHVVAPNWFHDLYLAQYRELYPEATFWAPAFLQRQRKSVVDRVLDGAGRPPWFDEMPHVSLSGLLTFDECIFFHNASRTLIAADLLMNAAADEQSPAFTRLGYWFFGLNGNLKVSKRQFKGLPDPSVVRIDEQNISPTGCPIHLRLGSRSTDRGSRQARQRKRSR